MAEEQEFQSPEDHRLCANNCGFSATPATLNLCSKCYRDHQIKDNQAKSAKSAVEISLLPSSSSSTSPPTTLLPIDKPDPVVVLANSPPVKEFTAALTTNRCFSCRKKVGLTGFGCRCGSTFCGVHRYPERHSCSFDYKSAGRFVIAKENPLVKADKLQKI
ncbi:zinc finger A20 and AN1 domain-containing stress-associated protein 6-like [Impatiens glandulifera]|uniref:zinc finger A20 and AN1 domain-containing stress-associated protein 6-like n=1 Tax=Impatiens glandulifera TaxID=253017 RepID=UPI001FB15B20|nr:zinc finger A20 and AN1 domain-containing stress-associated protein 6-like [Impatiens glandulifera]